MPERELTLPTANGSLELSEATFGSRCATGCRTMGGGMLFVRARRPDGAVIGEVTFCGDCVAAAMVDRIDAVRRAREGTSNPARRSPIIDTTPAPLPSKETRG